MAGPSKVVVLDPDVRSGRQIQLGFQREGVSAQIATVSPDLGRLELPTEDTGLVVVGGSDARVVELVRRTREVLEANHADAPIVFAGRGASRKDLVAAGADEVLAQPAYLRDVVTIGRLLCGQPANHRTHLVGSLAEITGVLTLVRALSALGRSAVLTLIRGLRRGEVRFYQGEVTSAQVGLIHGQAALHQLLLWTDARFDYHHEDVVRRQQIPLEHDELFADAERFLAGVRDSSGSLSPAMVLEQDVVRVQQLGKQIPSEVHGVLRMFDGHRVLADVLEDSPYRVFETLRVSQRALDVGLLKIASAPRPKATWRAVLAIEEWLVGAETRDDIVARNAVSNTGPVAKAETTGKSKKHSGTSSRRQRKKRRANTPLPIPVPAAAPPPDIDWGALVPRTVGAEVGPLAGVVPAAQRSGEIVLPSVPSRDEPREKLEALMDTGKREKIFPTDIGLEPSVVLDEVASGEISGEITAKQSASSSQTRSEVGRKKSKKQKAEAAAKAKAEAEAKLDEERAAAAAALVAAAKAQAERAKADADAQAAKAEADRAAAAMALAQVAREHADARADAVRDLVARHRNESDESARAGEKRAREEARARADVDGGSSTEGEAATAHAQARVAALLGAVKVAADAEAKARVEADERRRTDEVDKPQNGATTSSNGSGIASGEIRSKPPTSPADLVRALLDEERKDIETASTIVTETPNVVVAVRDRLSVTRTEQTARLVATPEATVSEVPFLAKPVAPSSSVIVDDAATRRFVRPGAEPEELDDAPSDGVIRARHTTAETTPSPARYRPPPGDIPVDDRPAETTGEIGHRRTATPPVIPAANEPSILVADLQAAHSAVSAVAVAQAAQASTTPNAAAAAATPGTPTAAASADVAQVRRDATGAFSQIEEDFFRAGTQQEEAKAPRIASASDSFDDLDEGYERVGFWDRLLGRKKK